MEIEIPTYFLCPISMQLMRDPVTIPTGITYDRENIEKWLFSCKRATCPVTKQPVCAPDLTLTPNHTLRRLIQGWCTLNAVDRIPTPKAAVDPPQIKKILGGASRLDSLRRLRSIAYRDDSSRIQLQAAVVPVVDFLSSVIREEGVREEVIDILHKLDLSEPDMRKLVSTEFLDSLNLVMDTGGDQTRSNAVCVLRSALAVADPDLLIGIRPDYFKNLCKIIGDGISPAATKAALKAVAELCPWGRNRAKAAGAGLAAAAVEVLLSAAAAERRVVELALAAVEQICRCAEGRAELLRHAAGVAVVAKKILRVSHAASERGVRILGAIARHAASERVLKEMAAVGAVTKMVLVLEVEASERCKERVREVLRLHARVWRGASCIPSHLMSSYPR